MFVAVTNLENVRLSVHGSLNFSCVCRIQEPNRPVRICRKVSLLNETLKKSVTTMTTNQFCCYQKNICSVITTTNNSQWKYLCELWHTEVCNYSSDFGVKRVAPECQVPLWTHIFACRSQVWLLWTSGCVLEKKLTTSAAVFLLCVHAWPHLKPAFKLCVCTPCVFEHTPFLCSES